jgi:hypothetical protein
MLISSLRRLAQSDALVKGTFFHPRISRGAIAESQFLGFQGQYTPKAEIPGRGVREMNSTSRIVFYNGSA